MTVPNDTTEWATQYSPREKFIRLIGLLTLAAGLMGLHHWLFLPWFNEFVNRPQCVQLFGISALRYFWQIIFIGIPLFTLVVVAMLTLPLGLKSLKEQRFPPRHVKVMKPTRVSVGRVAVFKAVGLLMLPVLMFVMVLWGAQQAQNMPDLDPAMLPQSECGTHLQEVH